MAERPPYSTASPLSPVERARRLCDFIHANRHRFTPSPETLAGLLRVLPLREVAERTGLTEQQIKNHTKENGNE